jgi:Copper amine oxidase, enzyme domain
MPDDLIVRVVPWGPDQTAVDTALRGVFERERVQEFLRDTQHRLLSWTFSEAEAKTSRAVPPRNYQATFYDYTHNRTIVVEGRLDTWETSAISESVRQPLPNHEEFDAAVQILLQDPELGPMIRDRRLQPYPPMPPLVEAELPDGRVERTLAVGLLPTAGGVRHEIVAVNMIRHTLTRFDRGAPERSEAHNPICGLPYAGQATTSSAAGQVRVTVRQGATVLWRFFVVRPAASSGTNGSGVELRYVDYRGKRVLYRAHVPILNVKYDPGGCGPYRDWQNEEGMIQANGTDVAPGFRVCPTPAQTILETGSDTGNFLGVAIYVQGLEVVLVSEMEAGWYRYISEWRLHADGTIRPRFGFSAVQSSCVCTRHHHHVYWRFDFDIRTPGNNVVREFNDPALFPGSNWHTKNYEIRRPRDPAHKRKWRVENSATGEGYEVIPGPDDGVATASPDWPFPRGDVWILRYRGTELDDGVVATGPPYEAGLDGFQNGEPINNQDVVIWYAAHVTHDIAAEPPGTFGHVVGPDLTPVNW